MADKTARIDELKRKIRQLKKLELKIWSSQTALPSVLVWDTFFELGSHTEKRAKYSLDMLLCMDRAELKDAINEFFFSIYYRLYKENGLAAAPIYDPEILTQLGLPFNSDYNTVKKKFRELALKYHPDVGGDADKFIELMDTYKRLTGDL
jgi:hypothetical protein